MKQLFCLIALFFLTGFSVQIQITEAEEYNLKAAFIYNFTRYINCDMYAAGNEFTIGIVGSSPIVGPLTELARTKKIGNRKITIVQFRHPEDITFTNILFISKNNKYPLSAVIDRLVSGTLTVSEEDGLATEGMAMNFIIEGNKLKFEANLKAIAAAGLKASSELLQHAIIINQ